MRRNSSKQLLRKASEWLPGRMVRLPGSEFPRPRYILKIKQLKIEMRTLRYALV
jgi:hypothetical protein